MITLSVALSTFTAKLSGAATFRHGYDVPVQIVFDTAPGDASGFKLALGDDSSAPSVLAYTDTFTQVNDTTWSAVLDGSDTRLVTFLTGKNAQPVNLQLDATIDGQAQSAPNVQVTVQPRIITGPTTSMGGPTYYSDTQTDAAIAAALAAAAAAAIVANRWLIKTADFAAVIGGKYQVDASGGAVTITLPTGMVAGDEIHVEDATLSFATHALTIAVAASGFGAKINGGTSSYVDAVVGDKLSIVGISSGQGVSIK